MLTGPAFPQPPWCREAPAACPHLTHRLIPLPVRSAHGARRGGAPEPRALGERPCLRAGRGSSWGSLHTTLRPPFRAPSRQHSCCQAVPPAASLLPRGRRLPSGAVLRLCPRIPRTRLWVPPGLLRSTQWAPNLCRLPLDSLEMMDRASRLASPQALLPTGAGPQRGAIPPCSRTFHGWECPPQPSSTRPSSRRPPDTRVCPGHVGLAAAPPYSPPE